MNDPTGLSGTKLGQGFYYLILGILALAIGLLCVEPLLKMAFSWELDSLTIRQKWHPPENRAHQSRIRLITIDAKTQADPVYRGLMNDGFSRRAAGYAIRFLNRTQPQAVILDISFNGGDHQDDLAGDQFLATSIQPGKPVISQLIFTKEGQSAQKESALPIATQAALARHTVQVSGLAQFPALQHLYRYNSMVPPYNALLHSGMQFYSATIGTFMTDLSGRLDDTQQSIRRWAPFSSYGKSIHPTLPIGIASHGAKQFSLSPTGRLSWGRQSIQLGAEGSPLIKWYGHGVRPDQPVYPEFSFSDVVLSEIRLECNENPNQPICKTPGLPKRPLIDPSRFHNQFTLIGFTTPDFDVHQTIYSPRYPGLFILANTLDNALHDDFVKPASPWLNLGLFLLMPALLSAFIFRFQSTLINLLVTATLSVGYFLVSLQAYYVWNVWIYAVYPILAMWACFSILYACRYNTEHKKRKQMRFAFGKYVSPAVLQIIEKQPEKITLGGERREMTFMFSDIRGFTTFSDHNEPEVVQTFLTQYFSTMNRIIMHQYQGSINKLIGDAIMAYWGFPLNDEDHAFLAVSAAMAMREAMLDWRKQSDKLPINIGIGINTGTAVIGNVGSEDFMDFTVIGDAVNVASRLEGVNKHYGTTIIISAATYEKVKDRIQARSLGWCELKGKGGQVEIFEPLGFYERPIST
ncbi:adenylate/guanylate cyclase domain-containing protein [Vampirovibrio sp.]|uniref:adenylate/guanylate cyclase domain-containing protein n=1 Tax=Vampirovibrio sp. TaxID=2717857 RepID=UPI0035939F04